MIKVVTFDLDGVYFLNGKSNFLINLEKLGVSENDARRVFLTSEKMNLEYKRGLITGEEFWKWAAGEWKLDMGMEKLVNLLISGYEVNGPAQDLVLKLREKGIKTAICSNNFPERIEGLEKRFGFLKNFDIVILSYQVGEVKPQPKIFKELINQGGVQPGEILYSDDSSTAIEAAKSLGINAFWYQHFEDFTENLIKFGIIL